MRRCGDLGLYRVTFFMRIMRIEMHRRDTQKYQAQHGKDQGLDQANKELERDEDEHHVRSNREHRGQQNFASKDIAEESEGQRQWPSENLQPTHRVRNEQAFQVASPT